MSGTVRRLVLFSVRGVALPQLYFRLEGMMKAEEEVASLLATDRRQRDKKELCVTVLIQGRGLHDDRLPVHVNYN